MKRKAICSFLLVFSLTGLAPVSIASDAAFGDAPLPPKGQSIVYLYRQSPLIPQATFFLNGTSICKLGRKYYCWFYITPDTYKLTIKMGGGATTPIISEDIVIEGDKKYFLRYDSAVTSIELYFTRYPSGRVTGIAILLEIAPNIAKFEGKILRYSPAFVKNVSKTSLVEYAKKKKEEEKKAQEQEKEWGD